MAPNASLAALPATMLNAADAAPARPLLVKANV